MSFYGGVDGGVRVLLARLRVPRATMWHKKRSCESSSEVFACRATRVAWQLCSCALCVCRHTSEQRHGMLRSRPLCVHVKGAGAVCGLRGRVCGLRTAVLE